MKVLGISCSPRKKGNTVIVLEERISAVIIGIETLPIFRSLDVRNFVELDDGVVATPRPDAGCIIITTLPTVMHHIKFYQTAVAAPWFDTVPADVL